MWFRNLVLYRTAGWKPKVAELEEALARQTFQPCGKMDMESRGWLPPRGEGDALVHALGGQMLIALGVEKKLLPASVINHYARERAAEIEEQQGFRPGRKQQPEIREQVTDELLPRAFERRRSTHAWIDQKRNIIEGIKAIRKPRISANWYLYLDTNNNIWRIASVNR